MSIVFNLIIKKIVTLRYHQKDSFSLTASILFSYDSNSNSQNFCGNNVRIRDIKSALMAKTCPPRRSKVITEFSWFQLRILVLFLPKSSNEKHYNCPVHTFSVFDPLEDEWVRRIETSVGECSNKIHNFSSEPGVITVMSTAPWPSN